MNLSISPSPPVRPSAAPLEPHAALPAGPMAWRRWADAMPDICLWLDPHDGRIVDCNRALFGALGYSRSEVLGWPLQALAEPRNLMLAGETWRRLAKAAPLRDADCVLRTRTGCELAVSATSTPVHDDGGRPVAGLVVWRDITERRRREQALQARKRQLKALAYELAAGDHQERTRLGQHLHDELGGLLMQARAALRRAGDGATASGPALAQLEELLGRTVAAARTAAERVSGPQPGPLGLQATLEHWARTLTQQGPLIVSVEGSLPDPLPLTGAAQAVLLRVLHELAANTRRHARARHLWFRMQAEGSRLSIVVGDDGTGFDTMRLPASLDAGQGAGLIVAEARMHAIGGRLVVQSRLGRGTRAVLTLGLRPGAPATTIL